MPSLNTCTLACPPNHSMCWPSEALIPGAIHPQRSQTEPPPLHLWAHHCRAHVSFHPSYHTSHLTRFSTHFNLLALARLHLFSTIVMLHLPPLLHVTSPFNVDPSHTLTCFNWPSLSDRKSEMKWKVQNITKTSLVNRKMKSLVKPF